MIDLCKFSFAAAATVLLATPSFGSQTQAVAKVQGGTSAKVTVKKRSVSKDESSKTVCSPTRSDWTGPPAQPAQF